MKTAIVVGFDYHVGVFCKTMNAHSNSWQYLPFASSKVNLLRALVRIGSADALISFAGPAPHPILAAAARSAKIPIFVIWAGTDVTRILQTPGRISQAQRSAPTHLAVSPWLADELKMAGIDAEYIPIIGVRPVENPDLPNKRFEVLTYLPETRRDFYGRPHVYEVARRSPDIHFLIVGAGDRDPSAPANVEFCGWLPSITDLIDRCTLVLRVPDHDGMSLMVLEALARGRFVAWKYALPGVRQVTTPDDTLRFLADLRDRFSAGTLGYNQEGLEFVTSVYEESLVSAGVLRLLEKSIERNTERVKGARQVVISGLDIFATEMADLNNQMHTGWNAEVLQFDTLYGTVGSLYNLARSDVWYTVGSPVPNRSLKIAATLLRKPRVMHWVGSDIETVRRKPAILKDLQSRLVTHLTEVEWEAEELQKLGIDAGIAPLPPRVLCSTPTPPLPAQFTLLTYLPRSRPDFYGRQQLETLIDEFAGMPVKFLIVGGGTIHVGNDASVECIGWRYKLDDVYARSSALFRFTPRDGLSLMVLEALSFGRHVLWTKNFPFVKRVCSTDAAVQALHHLVNLHELGMLVPQLEAAEFIQTSYDPGRCLQRITSTWLAACSAPARTLDVQA